MTFYEGPLFSINYFFSSKYHDIVMKGSRWEAISYNCKILKHAFLYWKIIEQNLFCICFFFFIFSFFFKYNSSQERFFRQIKHVNLKISIETIFFSFFFARKKIICVSHRIIFLYIKKLAYTSTTNLDLLQTFFLLCQNRVAVARNL